jgi:hypothetical protein
VPEKANGDRLIPIVTVKTAAPTVLDIKVIIFSSSKCPSSYLPHMPPVES